MRVVFAAWILLLVIVSVFPVSFKVMLHTNGPYHEMAHYLAFSLTAIMLWFVVDRPISRIVSFLIAIVFAYGQEWTENRIYHAGFEWNDVGSDLAGLLSGFALMVLITSLFGDHRR